MEYTFTCPKCSSQDFAIIEGLLTCMGCKNEYNVELIRNWKGDRLQKAAGWDNDITENCTLCPNCGSRNIKHEGHADRRWDGLNMEDAWCHVECIDCHFVLADSAG